MSRPYNTCQVYDAKLESFDVPSPNESYLPSNFASDLSLIHHEDVCDR
jgi:hypothetical protein